MTQLEHDIARVMARFPEVAAAWLFGSQIRGEARPDSDVDVGLVLKHRKVSAREVLPLLGKLAAELESVAPGHPIDLTLLEQQGPIFQHEVLRTGRLVWDADPERRVDFESDAYVRYFDFLPTHRIATEQALGGYRSAFGPKS